MVCDMLNTPSALSSLHPHVQMRPLMSSAALCIPPHDTYLRFMRQPHRIKARRQNCQRTVNIRPEELTQMGRPWLDQSHEEPVLRCGLRHLHHRESRSCHIYLIILNMRVRRDDRCMPTGIETVRIKFTFPRPSWSHSPLPKAYNVPAWKVLSIGNFRWVAAFHHIYIHNIHRQDLIEETRTWGSGVRRWPPPQLLPHSQQTDPHNLVLGALSLTVRSFQQQHIEKWISGPITTAAPEIIIDELLWHHWLCVYGSSRSKHTYIWSWWVLWWSTVAW